MALKAFLGMLLIVLFYPVVFLIISLAEELFAKTLRSLQTCALVHNSLYGKLVLSLESPTTFDESLKVTLVPFFIPDFNSLSCELDNFQFKLLYWENLCLHYIKTKIK